MALRVLLADESSTIKRVMQLALQDFGVEVKSVPVGLDVLPVTKTFKPDVIFADVLLAKRNGYEVCAELKADAETQNIPVILMWSGFMEIDDAKMNQAGPDARLEKPFDAEALRQMVQDLVPKTQNNPISPYLQFPKMPEFSESKGPAAAAPKASMATPPPAAKPAGRIPESAPVNFDKFDPTAEEENIFDIPEEGTVSGITRTTHDLPMVDDPEAIPDEAMIVADDEEFAAVPLKSSQQKDQHEDDGWQQQDLKKFKIQMPPADAIPTEDDFAKKFVIPQEELANAHVEVEGEFEEIHFGEDLTSTRSNPLPASYKEDLRRLQTEAVEKVQTKASPKISSQIKPSQASGNDTEMIERVIREEAREVIESICWKVIPEMAERIVREEINKILRDVEKSN
ncbi:response regulator [Bdellovibrio sp. HCB337]|uniref:response regulator n=1 Tax=Bdellovibrio sp. HCB337 TaxID=3394358 RepID=UPI0039A4FBF5